METCYPWKVRGIIVDENWKHLNAAVLYKPDYRYFVKIVMLIEYRFPRWLLAKAAETFEGTGWICPRCYQKPDYSICILRHIFPTMFSTLQFLTSKNLARSMKKIKLENGAKVAVNNK